jgi:ribosomal protein S8
MIMETYIVGYYAPSGPVLDDTFAKEKNRGIIKVLLDSYPTPLNYKQIASKGELKDKTVYGATYLPELKKSGFIREVEESEEKGGGSLAAKFVIENVNSLSRLRCPEYSIAPGNVVYSEGFKSALDIIINEVDIKYISTALLGFVRYIVENVKRIDDEHTKKVAPKKDMKYVCSTCGLNHEARDFIRATLLYLLDQFEVSTDYLEYLREQKYIDQDH